MERKMSLKIDFENVQTSYPVTYRMEMLLRRAVEETLDYEQFENPCEISITFTDNEGIHTLNKKYRGVDRPTDVLSFPMTDYDGESEEPPMDEQVTVLGDVVLSLEMAASQADTFGHSFEREVAFLTVHSMLHLLGYDHETSEEDEKDMRCRQSEIMNRMGLTVNES